MTKKEAGPLADLAKEMADKLPAHECCELLSRYMLSDFFRDIENGTFSGTIEHLVKEHGSLEAANMAVAIYQLNFESAAREKELFAQYHIEFPLRYSTDVGDAAGIAELKERLKAMMPAAARVH